MVLDGAVGKFQETSIDKDAIEAETACEIYIALALELIRQKNCFWTIKKQKFFKKIDKSFTSRPTMLASWGKVR